MVRGARTGRVALAAVLVALSGCFWQQPGAGPGHTGHNPHETRLGEWSAVGGAWSVQLDGPVGDPVTSGAGVHVAAGRTAYGFDVFSGDELWRHEEAAPMALLPPIAHGDQVVVNRWNPTATEATDPSGADAARFLDAATGAVEDEVEGTFLGWRGSRALLRTVNHMRLGRPMFAVWAEGLHVRDLPSGDEVCCSGLSGLNAGGPTATPPPPPPLTLGSEWIVESGPGVVDVAVPAQLPANGLRGYPIEGAAPCPIPTVALCPAWALPFDGTTSTVPVLDDAETTAYVGTDAGTLYAVDLATHTVRWSKAVGSAITAPPALRVDVLYVPTASGDLVVLDAGTGGEVARWPGTGSALTVQPAVTGAGLVITGDADGTVAGFARCRPGQPFCLPTWTIEFGSPITGAPAVSNGMIHVGTEDGRLFTLTSRGSVGS